MKRSIMAFAMVAAIALMGVTAAHAEMEWHVGAKGGVNIAKLTGDDVPDELDSRTGVIAGGFVGVAVNETFSIQVELLYSQEGAKESFDSAGVSGDLTIKLDYIHIPVLAVATFPASETVGINVFAGPFLGINTTAEVEAEASSGGISASGTEDISDFIKSIEFGGTVGAGVQFEAGGVLIVVDGRYSYGFTSVDDSDADESIKNGFFSFMGGVAIPLTN